MKYYPMKLCGISKSAIWGGKRLATQFGKSSSGESIAESWELSLRGDNVSVIENGIYAEMRLDKLLTAFPFALGTDVKGKFPLLVKLIDAADDLSVQVHPDNEYAALHECDSGKSELWYVIDADANAEIIYGTLSGIDETKLHRALTEDNFDDILQHVCVSRGDVFYIPSGQIHALGRGTLIAEIQQNSDITYRIFDYNRIGADGKSRELHIRKAIDVSRSYSSADIKEKQFCSRYGRRPIPKFCDVLADCEYFRVCKFASNSDMSIDFTIDEKAFAVLTFTSANRAVVTCGGISASVAAGDTFFIPAGAGKIDIKGEFTALLSEA